MMKLLVIREKFKSLYNVYGFYIDCVLKFLLALLSLITINGKVGFMNILKNPMVVIVISLICAFIPKPMIAIVVVLCMLGHLSSLSLEVTALVFIVVVVMYLLFFRFCPKDSVVLLLMPVLFMLKVPYIMPIALGLVATPASIVSIAFGTILYFIMNYIFVHTSELIEICSTEGLTAIGMIVNSVFKSKAMLFAILVFAITIIIVYCVRRMSIDNAFVIAVGSGGLVQLVTMLIGDLLIGMSEIATVPVIVLGGILSVIIGYLLQFLIYSVDYSRTERTQFEDDEYYYYVKAVPKVKVVAPEVRVKRINARKATNRK